MLPFRKQTHSSSFYCREATLSAISTPISMSFFPLTLFHGAEAAKTCIRCAPKKTQSRSDYFEGAKRHNPVAKRLFAGAKRLLRAEGACCWRRRRLVQGKKPQSRSDYFEGAKRHNIVSTVAKRLSRPFRHRFRSRFFLLLFPWCRRRNNMYMVCQTNSREATICRRKAPTTRA